MIAVCNAERLGACGTSGINVGNHVAKIERLRWRHSHLIAGRANIARFVSGPAFHNAKKIPDTVAATFLLKLVVRVSADNSKRPFSGAYGAKGVARTRIELRRMCLRLFGEVLKKAFIRFLVAQRDTHISAEFNRVGWRQCPPYV